MPAASSKTKIGHLAPQPKGGYKALCELCSWESYTDKDSKATEQVLRDHNRLMHPPTIPVYL